MRGVRARDLLGYVVAAAIIAAAAVWVAGHWDRVAAAFSLRPGYLAVLIPTAVANALLVGLLNQVVATHLGVRLGFWRWASLGFASTLVNYVLPARGGMAVRAAYYKRVGGLPLARFASSMAVIYVITVLVNAFAAMAGLLWAWLAAGVMLWPLFFVAAGLALVCVLALAFSPRPSERPAGSGLRATLAEVHRGWETLRTSRPLLGKVAAVVAAGTSMNVLRLYVVYLAIGHPVSAAGCLLVGALAGLGTFLSFTPGALGIRDGAIVFGSMAVGVSAEAGLLASVLDRAVLLVVVLSIGPFAALRISRETARGKAE
ncbi:MAG: lysylphosphatidylglycerol synthase transmembrane domain-containing protein [Planctomycetota bacterium]